ncbi:MULTISPECIES: hypothetical protein [unclassified Halobacteriovorax]|uniref:hypothetical protein n=1 Tax=unclassified Halobacteriovorax TaxID=2639665 RepID=UPI00399C1446
MDPKTISTFMSGLAGMGAAPAQSGVGPNGGTVYIEGMRINQPSIWPYVALAVGGVLLWRMMR